MKKEKEIEQQTEQSEASKHAARRDLYLSTLESIAQKDKPFSSLLLKLKHGISTSLLEEPLIAADTKSSPDTAKKLANYERVMKEMKKQIAG